MSLNLKQIIPLVAGGGSGIGLGLVKEFPKRGSPKVVITGRREAVLQQGELFFVARQSSYFAQ